MDLNPILDTEFRAALFAYLSELRDEVGIVKWADLRRFEFKGEKRQIIGQNGIQRPRDMGLLGAVSILTTFSADPSKAPYDDEIADDGYVRYKWRGTDGSTWDNEALRLARQHKVPLVWFRGVDKGLYQAVFPVWIAGEEPTKQQFVLAFEEDLRDQWTPEIWMAPDLAARRRYAESSVKRRLHQPYFRARVLEAYDKKCAMCHLKHVELLEAAHIREDSANGEPVVTNGISMCVIHHKAYDTDFIGIRPDYIIEVRSSLLDEQDGPTLRHALQGVHQQKLILPRQQQAHPDAALLEERYQRFRAAS